MEEQAPALAVACAAAAELTGYLGFVNAQRALQTQCNPPGYMQALKAAYKHEGMEPEVEKPQPLLLRRLQTAAAQRDFISAEEDMGDTEENGKTYSFRPDGVYGRGYYPKGAEDAAEEAQDAGDGDATGGSAEDPAGTTESVTEPEEEAVEEAEAEADEAEEAATEAATEVAAEAEAAEAVATADTDVEEEGEEAPAVAEAAPSAADPFAFDAIEDSDDALFDGDGAAPDQRQQRARDEMQRAKERATAAHKAVLSGAGYPKAGGGQSRKRKRWTAAGEEALRAAVAEYGCSWATILHKAGHSHFNGRTQGDLKDKWRNMNPK